MSTRHIPVVGQGVGKSLVAVVGEARSESSQDSNLPLPDLAYHQVLGRPPSAKPAAEKVGGPVAAVYTLGSRWNQADREAEAADSLEWKGRRPSVSQCPWSRRLSRLMHRSSRTLPKQRVRVRLQVAVDLLQVVHQGLLRQEALVPQDRREVLSRPATNSLVVPECRAWEVEVVGVVLSPWGRLASHPPLHRLTLGDMAPKVSLAVWP